MAATIKEDKRWSNKKKMEGEDSLRTLECLRGRLLSERQASRVAKEEAELMGNKLIELENKLREETKLRKKAVKKLNFLVKRLETLKISTTLEELELSSSFENGGSSCTSSTSSSDTKDLENVKNSVTKATESNNQCNLSIQESSSINENSDSSSDQNLTNSPCKSSRESSPSFQDSQAEHDKSSSSLKATKMEVEAKARNESDGEDNNVDNTMALVPVSSNIISKSSSDQLKVVDNSVSEVLDALRHAREKIESTMERKEHMIRVGPP